MFIKKQKEVTAWYLFNSLPVWGSKTLRKYCKTVWRILFYHLYVNNKWRKIRILDIEDTLKDHASDELVPILEEPIIDHMKIYKEKVL